MKRLLLLLAALLSIPVLPADVQAQNAIVVASCGTLPTGITYATNQTRPVLMDVNGLLCMNGSGGGGGTVTQGTGNPANPWYVAQSGTWNINNITGTVTLPTGAATSALQTQISGQFPASLGAKAGAGSLSVVPNTDTPFQIVGNVASATADSGNPVKVGGVYRSTLTSVTTGQRADMPTDPYGRPSVGLGSGSSSAIASVGAFSAADGSANQVALSVNSQNQLFNGTTWDRTRGDVTGAWAGGHASIATGQISVGTTATLVAAARTGRQKIGLTVTSAVQCAYGNSGVTLTTGWPLAAVAYASDSWDTAAALYAVCASTATVAYREQF